MSPSLLDRVADKVLRESLRVRAGENVTIETWNTGLDFALRTALRARRIGAASTLLFEDEDTFVQGVRLSPRKYLGRMGEHEQALLSRTDAYVFVPSPLLGGSPRLAPGEVASSTAYNSSWYDTAKKARLRGVRMMFGYVGTDLAEVLRKPLDRIVEHQLTASLVDFRKVRRAGLALSRVLRPGCEVVVAADGERLRFELGQEDALDDGMVDRRDLSTGGNMTNMPPGYYAREIVPSSLTGAVQLYAPVPRIRAMADLRLEFNRGRLTNWSSEKNPRWLNGLIAATPENRRKLSAVGVGLNPYLRDGYGQDRLAQGAVTFFGMFQGTTRVPTVEVDGSPIVRENALVPAVLRGPRPRAGRRDRAVEGRAG